MLCSPATQGRRCGASGRGEAHPLLYPPRSLLPPFPAWENRGEDPGLVDLLEKCIPFLGWLKGVGGRVWKLTQVCGVEMIGRRATGDPQQKNQVKRPDLFIPGYLIVNLWGVTLYSESDTSLIED